MAIGTTAAIVGASALGAGANFLSSRSASRAQSGAADRAADIQAEIYGQTRADLEPWRAGGQIAQQGAISMLGLGPAPSGPDIPGGVFGGFQATPGYQFRVDETQRAIDNSAAARGGLFSGATVKEGARFRDGLASLEFENYYNRLMDMSNRGQNSAAAVGSAGANYASGAGNALMAGGNARASGAMAAGNAFSGFLGDAVGAYGLNQARQSAFQPLWRP